MVSVLYVAGLSFRLIFSIQNISMRKFWIVSLACTLTAAAQAQKPAPAKPRINHLALYVNNLATSTQFYTQVIGLDTIPEPFHDGRHTWLSIGGGAHLHLISGNAANQPHPKNTHLCFTVPSVPEFADRLKKAGISFENWAGDKNAVTTRVDGVKQLYLTDPDGFWLEINDAKD